MKNFSKYIFGGLLSILCSEAFSYNPYMLLLRQYDETGLNQLAIPVEAPEGPAYLYFNPTTHIPEWGLSSAVTMTSTQISDTSSIGRELMTSANQTAARTAIGAGTSNFNGSYASLSNAPTNITAFTNNAGYITAASAPVISVNGSTGAVVLTAASVGAAATSHTHTASQISDSTTIGRSLLTATDQAAVKSIAGVPTAVSQLSNDSSYITSSALAAYVTSSSLTATLVGYATTSALTSGLSSKFNSPSGTTAQYLRGDGTTATFPSIPSAQVNSDWSASSGVSQILNKPTKYTGTTNGSGIYTVTYGSAYSTKPHIVFSVEGGTNKDTSVLTSATTTGFSILVERRTDVLGLLPSYAAVSGITVNVIVTP